jgi:hypothetical protein
MCAQKGFSGCRIGQDIIKPSLVLSSCLKSNGIFDLISSFIARINVKTKTERQLLCFVGKRDVKQIPLAFSDVKQCDINIRENKTSP